MGSRIVDAASAQRKRALHERAARRSDQGMSDEGKKQPDPVEDAREHLKQGFGLLFRAAQDVAGSVKREIDKGGVGKALDDAGREIARAANNVFSRLATEIEHVAAPEAGASGGPSETAQAAPESWPTTREEYERRIGPTDDDAWPRSREAYEKRYGEPPPTGKPKGPTKADPGFRIAVDDDEPR